MLSTCGCVPLFRWPVDYLARSPMSVGKHHKFEIGKGTLFMRIVDTFNLKFVYSFLQKIQSV